MSLDPDSPPEYLVGHLEDALARDPRVSEQGLRVEVSPGTSQVVVTGMVSAAGAKSAVVEVIHELMPGIDVMDETTVAEHPEDDEIERLP
jgi:hypothetical protein